MATIKNICMETLERHCMKEPNGRLDLRRGAFEGEIYTYGHFIVHAQIGMLEGVPALFRLLDWGDAETFWTSDVVTDKTSLHLPMGAACILYAEHLQQRAEWEAQARLQKVDSALLTPELVAGQANGMQSVLKNYLISLECNDPNLLPGGFVFSDAAKSSYVIGSSEECEIPLRHPSVDPLHCGVILENGNVCVWDLGAQSGVKLNDVSISEDTLKVGDIMTLGEIELRVRFNLRRPTLKPKSPEQAATPQQVEILTAGNIVKTASLPSPSKFRGPITYDKISKQLKGRTQGQPFLTKLGSLFGKKR